MKVSVKNPDVFAPIIIESVFESTEEIQRFRLCLEDSDIDSDAADAIHTVVTGAMRARGISLEGVDSND